ncbi:MAG: TetR/AcrR family transcriptional regulator [Gammaproteobacteria bacterium]|nr:TetR/AcrR family transcriptional regulator [Gammaproteobacteria bacterium]
MPSQPQFNIDETLAKAVCQFWTHGYHATSMSNLVDVMGINRASIYNTYGDKRTLFIRSLEQYHVMLREVRLERLAEQYGALERITALFDLVVADAESEDVRRGCLVMNTALELAAHEPDVREVILSAQNTIKKFFRDSLAEACGKRLIAGELDDEAQFLLTLLSGFLVQVRNCENPGDMTAVTGRISGYLNNLLHQSGKEESC